ncbi:MAG: glycerol kinase GlpK [Hyphomicrobiales bacterium]
MGNILAIDQGTTSSRAIIFSGEMNIITLTQEEFPQHFPKPGWVEHDPEDIWASVVSTVRDALSKAQMNATDIAGLGITNQRETTVLWNRKTGKAVYNAIVWQDRRTEEFCVTLREDGFAETLNEKTGLLADPYFSGTKIAWILDNVDGARVAAEKGELAFGTIDAFLIWRLTGGKVHATDATNASRTMLFNIHTQEWDDEILTRLNIPRSLLPEVKDCAADFGSTDPDLFGATIPIAGVAGDQQSAAIGQACFKPGMMKSTYGTGCFAILNTGKSAVRSKNRLLTTLTYRLNGKVAYALEGSIFMAGAAVQWLRDGLQIIESAAETGKMAEAAASDQDVYMVPAFVGLGAPYWDAEAQGAIYGLSRGTGRNELVRATLEAVCYQTRDLLEAMQDDMGEDFETTLRVDGGMVASDWTMQFLSNILNAPVDRPTILETTALGAAWLAGSHVGAWPDQLGFSENWKLERCFTPQMSDDERTRKYAGWKKAVERTLTTSS